MHKTFISYHHANDQDYQEELVRLGRRYRIFIDQSVDTGDISENLKDEVIREKIRDEYLRDSTITIVLIGLETKGRKHVDWEIYSSMINGKVNKKSGLLVVSLPLTNSHFVTAPHDGEHALYPEFPNWYSIDHRSEYERRYPYVPERIIDNLLNPKAKISVTKWETIANNPKNLRFLIDAAFQGRSTCKYDLRREMRKHNSPRQLGWTPAFAMT